MWIVFRLSVLALCQSGNLSRVYPASHLIVAGIGFSPPAIEYPNSTLNSSYLNILMYEAVFISTLFYSRKLLKHFLVFIYL